MAAKVAVLENQLGMSNSHTKFQFSQILGLATTRGAKTENTNVLRLLN
jgi:hypothetical protein